MIYALVVGIVLAAIGLVRRNKTLLWVGVSVLVVSGLIMLLRPLFFE